MYKAPCIRILIFERIIGSLKVSKIGCIENFQLYGITQKETVKGGNFDEENVIVPKINHWAFNTGKNIGKQEFFVKFVPCKVSLQHI